MYKMTMSEIKLVKSEMCCLSLRNVMKHPAGRTVMTNQPRKMVIVNNFKTQPQVPETKIRLNIKIFLKDGNSKKIKLS